MNEPNRSFESDLFAHGEREDVYRFEAVGDGSRKSREWDSGIGELGEEVVSHGFVVDDSSWESECGGSVRCCMSFFWGGGDMEKEVRQIRLSGKVSTTERIH